jgi:protein tyrosine phosphatase (PTP) superfamily phosphohydrolase (DUF442 family)
VAAGLLLALAVKVGATYFGRNWHELIPGQVYRCAQLTPDQLRQAIRRHGIRTVVNLRGCCPDFDWYRGECRATFDLDVSQEDVTLSAIRLPAPAEVRRLVEIFERTEPPILFHCRQGVDRTGVTAALALLLTTDTSLPVARRQLSLRYGHVAIGPTAAMGEFLDLYEDWLRDQGRPHSRGAFREWAGGAYCPAHCRGRLEVLDSPGSLRVGVPSALRVRAHNTSIRPWRLTPGTETGVHVRYLVFNAEVTSCTTGRAGLFDATVAPGDSIDLTLALPAFAKPGRYVVQADLSDRNRCTFSQLGSEPLEIVLQVIE